MFLSKWAASQESTCGKGDQRLIEFSINPVTHGSPGVTWQQTLRRKELAILPMTKQRQQ